MSIQNPRWEKNKAEKDKKRQDPTQNPKALTTHVQGIRQLSFIVYIPKPSCSSSLCFPFPSFLQHQANLWDLKGFLAFLPSFFQWSCYGLARRSLYWIPCMDHLPFQQCFFLSFHQHALLSSCMFNFAHSWNSICIIIYVG